MRKRRVLEIRITRGMTETPATRFLWGRPLRTSIYEAEAALARALHDPRIAGLVLEIADPHLGWSKAETLHRAIRALREQGKPTIAHLEGGGNTAYLLASACETVVLGPSTILALQPLSSEALFFKDFLGEAGVDPELDAVGEFKSAGEMFERRRASEPHRRQLDSILRDLQEQFIARIVSGRGLSSDRATRAVMRGPYIAEDAQSAGLVDHVEPEDFCDGFLETELGGPVKRVPHLRYVAPPGWLGRLWSWRLSHVALVTASGVLTRDDSGRPGPPAASARGLQEILRNLRHRRRVRALVLRVASPGGGAVASDIVHRELALTAKKMPVVVSMGDVAASGGYYIAAAAGTVIAEGTSLTGSIGVVGGKFVVRRLLDRLGIHRERVSLGGNAGMFSPWRPFTDEERAWHRRHLEHFYHERFLRVVAEGRKLTRERADELGRGRVWTGRQAAEAGLVDRLGGLDEAIRVAREAAGLSEAKSRVVVYGRKTRWLELVPFGRPGGARGSLFDQVLGKLALVDELAQEDLLLVMPGWFRIR